MSSKTTRELFEDVEALVATRPKDDRRNFEEIVEKLDNIEQELVDRAQGRDEQRAFRRRLIEAKLSIFTTYSQSISEVRQLVDELEDIGFGDPLREATTIGRFAKYAIQVGRGTEAKEHLNRTWEKLHNDDLVADLPEDRVQRFRELVGDLRDRIDSETDQ